MARHLPTSKKWSSHQKEKILHKIQWRTYPEGSKIQAWYFRQGCIHSVWASGMELLAKEIRLCDEIEAFKRNLKTHLFVKFVNDSTLAIWFWRIIAKHPRMLFAQFVVLYKPCKPKLKPKNTVRKWFIRIKCALYITCYVSGRSLSQQFLNPTKIYPLMWSKLEALAVNLIPLWKHNVLAFCFGSLPDHVYL